MAAETPAGEAVYGVVDERPGPDEQLGWKSALDSVVELCGWRRDLRVLLWYYLDGKTYDEIGSLLGVTRERARQILLSCRKGVANWLWKSEHDYRRGMRDETRRLVREAYLGY